MNYKNKFILFLIIACTALVISCSQTPNKKDPATDVKKDIPAAKQKIPADKNRLIGDWVRTDSPYQIKITAVQDDGILKAGYYNPKSIHVARAMWNNSDGILKVYVELRDENYPGSNYKLNYFPEKDALAGEYFQAVEGITYDVAFTRAK
jgi:hypothetical protein